MGGVVIVGGAPGARGRRAAVAAGIPMCVPGRRQPIGGDDWNCAL